MQARSDIKGNVVNHMLQAPDLESGGFCEGVHRGAHIMVVELGDQYVIHPGLGAIRSVVGCPLPFVVRVFSYSNPRVVNSQPYRLAHCSKGLAIVGGLLTGV